jgi:hypothetical protein
MHFRVSQYGSERLAYMQKIIVMKGFYRKNGIAASLMDYARYNHCST